MKLILFTTKVDKGGREIIKEAKKTSLGCQAYFCEELLFRNDEILDSSLNPISILQDDKIILRDPYNSKHNYHLFTKMILEKYYKNVSLDRERYSKFPQCEDKLFQVNLFMKLGITTPQVFFGRNIIKLLNFPVIVKPRIGSRGRGIRIFRKPEILNEFFENKDISDHIIQKFHKVKNEYRIILLQHKTLGMVDKNIYSYGKDRIRVTINKKVNPIPEKIVQDAKRITKALKADFVGIDIIQAEDGKYYFLEANFAPQFSGFAKAMNINVANKIVRSIIL